MCKNFEPFGHPIFLEYWFYFEVFEILYTRREWKWTDKRFRLVLAALSKNIQEWWNCYPWWNNFGICYLIFVCIYTVWKFKWTIDSYTRKYCLFTALTKNNNNVQEHNIICAKSKSRRRNSSRFVKMWKEGHTYGAYFFWYIFCSETWEK